MTSGNLIVDGSQLLMANLAVNDDDYTNAGDYLGGVTGLLRQLAGLINMFQPHSMFVAFDVDKSAYRLGLHPGYKAGRRLKTTPEMAEKFKHRALHTTYLKELLPLLGVYVLIAEGVEGDDVIANFVKKSGRNNTIVSTDKDFIQLVGPHTRLYRPVRPEPVMVTMDNVADILGCRPDVYLKTRYLAGDVSDNIEGVRGVANKTALKIFKLAGSEEPEEILKWAETECKFKYKDTLVEFLKADRWNLNSMLMDLNKCPDVDIKALLPTKPMSLVRDYSAAFDFLIDLEVDDYIFEDDIHQILTTFDDLK